MLTSMQETLEFGFAVLNRVYFKDSLPMPVITIMSSPRTNGHFTVGKTWRAENDHLHEINISAEHLDRPIENIMATLCHEMVHYFCLLNGIKDTSQNHRYHNKLFRDEAEKRGLLITRADGIGYSITAPSPDFIKVLQENHIEKPLDINRESEWLGFSGGGNGGNPDGQTGGLDGIQGTMRKKTSTRKYQCPSCKNSFRATKDINVMCLDCLEQFIKIMK